MPERNIKVTVAYDGTDFLGWQLQKKGRTVQGVMQDGLGRMHGHPVHVLAAGRTDSGVHATGQVANFHSDLDSIPAEKFRDAVNSFLPWDVRILASEDAGPRFHARRSARLRVYRYYIVNGPVLLPHLRNYRHWVRRPLDIPRLNEMASVIVGEHDFSCFSAEGDANVSKVRQVTVSSFHADGDTLTYTIAATSFLWKMVRTVIGTFLMLEEQGLGAPELLRIIESGSRANAGGTAPARGLFLERVYYDEENGLPSAAVEGAEPAARLGEHGILP
ncbi:MAG TPA: tRNA pseudouridine(38-40) synthase TruA [Spirochaetia bacterium]|nr:tRNA pseudouridine(38-40) synthase TruA [Spirochaetia bacterium]